MSKLFDTKQDIERLLYSRNLTLEVRNRTVLLRDPESGEEMQLEAAAHASVSRPPAKMSPIAMFAALLVLLLIIVGIVHFMLNSQ